ncbi:MAG: BrnT family toxin [Ignavibacteria bacterium]|nr:BrnT family toxin [Ignavibacteria bacterium]
MAETTAFEWDEDKNKLNQKKHNISFEEAQYAFSDSKRIIAKDLEPSESEERYYCFGKIGENILTVRFTYRNNKIRIIGAGYWRKGKQIYEEENKI